MIARTKPWLVDLNPTQAYAARAPVADLAIVAGPGSGKTRVLAARVLELVETFGVHPGSIVAFTFTRAAAGELARRIVELGGEDYQLVRATTFSAFALEIVRRNPKAVGIPDGFSVADPAAVESARLSLHEGPLKRPEASRVTKTRVSEALAALYATGRMPTEAPVSAMVVQFLGRLADVGLAPPGILVPAAVRLLGADAALAEEFRERSHVLVDEAHDAAPIEVELVRFLSAGEPTPGRLSLVLDPRQAIFGWRGALGGEVLAPYAEPNPQREVVELPRSYRFGAEIAAAANHVAALAGYRGAPVVGTGEPGSVTLCPHGDVGRHLADMRATYGPREVSVLTRSRNTAADVAGNHPDLVASVHDSDHEPAWLELAKAMSDLALNPSNPTAFRLLYETEEPYLHTRRPFTIFASRVGRARTLAAEYLATLAGEEAEAESLLWFATNVADPTLVTLDDLAGRVVEFLNRHKSRQVDAADAVPPTLERLGVSRLGLRDAADRLALRSESDRFAAVAESGLSPVSTIHAAKGREWRGVVLVTDAWPWRLSRKKSAEEWRTLFVAITRARTELVVAHPVEVNTGGVLS